MDNLPTYAEALTMSQEQLKEKLAPVKIQRARQKGILEMAELDVEIADKRAGLVETCVDEDICFDDVIELIDQIALLERRKKQYQEILEKLFPEM